MPTGVNLGSAARLAEFLVNAPKVSEGTSIPKNSFTSRIPLLVCVTMYTIVVLEVRLCNMLSNTFSTLPNGALNTSSIEKSHRLKKPQTTINRKLYIIITEYTFQA